MSLDGFWEFLLTAWNGLGPKGFMVWLISGLVMLGSGALFIYLTTAVLSQMGKKPEAGVTSTQTAAPTHSPGNIIQTGPAVGPNPAPAPSAPITQTNITGSQIAGPVTINVYKPESLTRFDEQIQMTRAEVKLESDIGKRSDVQVYMLWRDASWTKRQASLTSEAGFEKFLRSDRMSEAIDNAEFIGCIGLASNEMTTRLSAATSDEKEEQLGKLSDRRATRLCEYVAEAARERDSAAKFVGIGIGYNTRAPSSAAGDEIKQRQSILVRVNRKSGPVLTKDDVRSVVAEIIRKIEIEGFKPGEYSRVVEKRPFCWIAMEQGTFDPSKTDCDTN